MSDKLLWYPWHPADFLAETVGWTLYEQGAYRALLDYQWLNGSIPADPKKIRKLLGGMRSRVWNQFWPKIGHRMAKIGKNELANERLEKIREHALRVIGVRSKIGHLGAIKRWNSSQPNNGNSHGNSHLSRGSKSMAIATIYQNKNKDLRIYTSMAPNATKSGTAPQTNGHLTDETKTTRKRSPQAEALIQQISTPVSPAARARDGPPKPKRKHIKAKKPRKAT